MPVPVWDCSDLGLLDEPQDTATVVSNDIWKKFDLDFPLDRVDAHFEMYHERPFDDGVLPDLLYDKMTCLESREIRHHDCMWAGLCISKEHNRTLPAKKDSQIQKKVPAGRSVLISRASAVHLGTTLPISQQAQQQCRAKNLESDGDSTRPETPQSSSSDTETEDEGPFFRHDQINIHEKLSECMSEAATKAVPVSEVTGQQVRFHDRRKEEDESQCQVHRETNIRNTLSDHCYHLNQPIGKNLEHLGVQTPSDSAAQTHTALFLSISLSLRLSSPGIAGIRFILRIRQRINEFIHLLLLCPPKRRQQGRTKDPLNRVQLTATPGELQFAEFGSPHEYANHAFGYSSFVVAAP
ncbi:hypothetical protein WN48_04682 [Eufriesea mexicana]|uniref:Uncharacterized protein n=1 Tax=Eufriesea mexicana TaxID=516756 RepID=A0A310SLA3_9HYME|nr:hypothetical protein WN48_04682 [Eufriesea mexicana]